MLVFSGGSSRVVLSSSRSGSTLWTRRRGDLVARPDSSSYRPAISTPTQVGGDPGARAVTSGREPVQERRACVLVRGRDRAPRDRGPRRDGRQTQCGGCAALALVRTAGDRSPRAPDLRAPAFSVV